MLPFWIKPKVKEIQPEGLPLYIEAPLPPPPRAPKIEEKEERGVFIIELF